MDRTKVNSSNINSIGHDETKNLLEVEFYNQSIYQYHPVSRETYLTILASESAGKAFNELVKNKPDVKAKRMN